MGGIKIVRESSRHNIEKKLKDLEEQKNQGFITLEEYDTLRIRYERKLGNKEAVSKLQEAKGFKPSTIKEKKAKKQELYDDFVDQYSVSEGKDYGEIQRSRIFGKTTIRALVILFILLAFGIGIMARISAIQSQNQDVTPNVTITDSAFSANATIIQSSNMTVDTSNVTYNVTKKSTKKYTKKSSAKNTTKSSTTTKKESSEKDSSSDSNNQGSDSKDSKKSGSSSD